MSLGDRFGHTQAVPGVWASLSTSEGVRDRARRSVASRALGGSDCDLLLSMLGLAHSDQEVAAFKRAAVSDAVIQAQEATDR